MCVGFTDFILKDKSLLDHTYVYSTNDYDKNDKITFSITKKMKSLHCVICGQ